MNQAETISVVITDTSILINLLHSGHLPLLGRTAGYQFLIPDEVLAEIRDPDQRGIVEGSITEGVLGRATIETPEELAVYAELTLILGSGEAACLAVASSRGWLIACDERRVFLREARTRLGQDRLINTPGLFLLWIRAGLLTVAEADAAKLALEGKRFKMAFESFRELA